MKKDKDISIHKQPDGSYSAFFRGKPLTDGATRYAALKNAAEELQIMDEVAQSYREELAWDRAAYKEMSQAERDAYDNL